MPKYTFTVTRDITESTTVTVEADSISEAHAEALVMDIDGWEVDDNPGGNPYIPDPSDYESDCEVEPTRYAVIRKMINGERIQVAQVKTAGDPYEDFHKRFRSSVDYTPMETTDDESPDDYRYRIGVAE